MFFASRFTRLGLCAGLIAITGLALWSAPAGAVTGYENLCPSLLTPFCGGGAIMPNYGIAVDNSTGLPSSGDVWVASGDTYSAGHELLKLDPAGNLLVEVVIPVPKEQTLFGVAVDPADGDVYASKAGAGDGPGTVTKFDSSGKALFELTGSETPQGYFAPFSVAVASNGDLYVSDNAHSMIDTFTSNGKYVGQFSVPGMLEFGTTIAVSPEGDLYVYAEPVGGAYGIHRYTPSGAPVDCPGAGNVLQAGAPFAVDPSSGNIFVEAGSVIDQYSGFCAAEPTVRLGEKVVDGGGRGLAVSASTHDVYATSSAGNNVGWIFGQVTLPDVTTGAPATSVTRDSAQVSGTVNPLEIPVTSCEFEYGPNVTYGSSVPCEQALPLEGTSPVTVTAQVKSGESPASLVHYRLKIGFGTSTNVGNDKTFRLEEFAPPIVGGLEASNLTQFSATLNGTLQTGEALVNYHFEYGTTTAYGSIEPIPDNYTPISGEPLTVSQPVSKLQAGMTYHYRLVASSPGGTEVAGPDETFTTLAIPAPSVATGAASGVGVGGATLSGAVDPHGWDSSYLFEYGTSTSYGSSWPSVLVDMGALEGPQPVIVNVPNLLPSTTYHYRLIATNGGGTSYGPDLTFTTGEYPVSVIQPAPALTPAIVFPKEEPNTSTTTTAKALTNAQKLAKALKQCRKKGSKAKRAGCERKARKIAGEFLPDPSTGRLTALFDENPNLPFSDLKLHFFGGPRAELATPEACGTFTVNAELTPYSFPDSGLAAGAGGTLFDNFVIDEACPGGFSPSFTAGGTNLQAGAYTPFVASFQRSDTDQELQGLTVTLPPGLLADVASVPLCGEAEANAGTCPEASQVGTVETTVGPGPNPLQVAGRAYLTGPYNGGPYGLSVVVPAVAGPFNFGTVVVRQSIRIDPATAQVSDVSDPFPTIIAGIPLRLRRVDVTLSRPGFMFNPTSCAKLGFAGVISGSPLGSPRRLAGNIGYATQPGATSSFTTPFQVTNCTSLKFQPKFTVSTSGKTSRSNGASLTAKLSYPNLPQGAEANIARVKVDLPKQLPSRLTTLQKACTAAQFNANPAGCPSASKIGFATVHTPILPGTLSGPAIFVSHGGEAFPSLTMVLQGDNVTVDLVGTTFISKAGITSTTFKTVPDTPFSTFELKLPEGKFSALAANGNLCKSKLAMPTEFLAQNGAKINESTKVSVTGCKRAKQAAKKHGHKKPKTGKKGGKR
jgi:hypothetical protein